MSEQTSGSGSGSLSLPDSPSLEWLRKQAKRQLDELRQSNADARLTDAQFEVAKQYGFSSWRALKAHVDSLTVAGQLFAAARTGDVQALRALLDADPPLLHARSQPHALTLLHTAAQHGRLAVVDLLLTRGLDVDSREKGDNTTAMHWAAAGGYVDVVRRLADAGGDVIGHGDAHELEIIGWATCWEHGDNAAHRVVADFLVGHGAHHHIFSAIALSDEKEARRVVATDRRALERRMSRYENHQRPLHFATRKNLAGMVALLLELGADPSGTDDSGYTTAVYATDPDTDRSVMEVLRERDPHNLIAALGLHDWNAAAQLMRDTPGATDPAALHLMAKRGDSAAVRWLLEHDANPNALWSHWDAKVTPLHLAAWQGHADVVRLLLDAGADAAIRDSKHDGDALGWAEQGGRADVVRMLRARADL